jgi:hypothetical protein
MAAAPGKTMPLAAGRARGRAQLTPPANLPITHHESASRNGRPLFAAAKLKHGMASLSLRLEAIPVYSAARPRFSVKPITSPPRLAAKGPE